MNPKWDTYFLELAKVVASNSSCLSRQVGALLVRDRSIISTGYNGPPRGIPHCSIRMVDQSELSDMIVVPTSDVCPRRLMGYNSGEGLEYCVASHAEVNCINNAARNGVCTLGTTMYMTCGIPCKSCLGEIINAGISSLVCTKLTYYDTTSLWLVKHSNLTIRQYYSDKYLCSPAEQRG
jgi:dCMP deaminase